MKKSTQLSQNFAENYSEVFMAIPVIVAVGIGALVTSLLEGCGEETPLHPVEPDQRSPFKEPGPPSPCQKRFTPLMKTHPNGSIWF